MIIQKNKRKYIGIIAGVIVGGLGMLTSAQATDKIVVKFPTVHGSEDSVFNKVGKRIGEELESRLPGVFDFQLYPGSSLGGEREILEGLRIGTVEMTSSGVAGIVDPVFNIVDMPFLFSDRDHVYSVLDGPIGTEMLANIADERLVALGYVEAGWRHITNNVRPIETPEDIEGLKQRVVEHEVYLATMRALGANPVPIPYGELYTALKTGVVDGQDNPLINIYTSKMYEVQKYLTLSGHVYSNNVILASRSFWDKLDGEQRNAVSEAVKVATVYGRKLSIDGERDVLAKLKTEGMIVNAIEDKSLFVEATKSVYDQFDNKYPEGLVEKIREFPVSKYPYAQ